MTTNIIIDFNYLLYFRERYNYYYENTIHISMEDISKIIQM